MKRAAALFVGLTALACAPNATAENRQAAAVKRLSAESSAPVSVFRNPTTRRPYFVTGRIPAASFSSSADPARQGADFWRSYGALFGVGDAATELVLRKESTDAYGVTHLRYDQRYRGLHVFGRQLLLHLQDGEVIAANGHFADGIEFETAPAVSATGAAFTATGGIPARGGRSLVGTPTLLVHVNGLDRARLAWRVTVSSSEPLGVWRVFVDAQTGDVLQAYNDLHTAKNRITYTNGNDPDCNTQGTPLCTLPGGQVRDEDDAPVGDAIVQETHVNSGLVYDYYSSTFGRDSYDDAGHVLRSTVHFGAGYDNAFWCGDACVPSFGSAQGGQMVYGDGSWNGATGLFSPLGQDLDVVAHELTHAVTEDESGLEYVGQSGALNESYSDVFAAMIDNDGGEWLIGEKSWTPGTPGDALRNMADPAAEGQPAHMTDYLNTWYDNAGVHTNSGIPNHAAYLAATDPGYGIGRSNVQRIYYAAMPCLSSGADFLENLQCLLVAAGTVFPGDDSKARAVRFSQAAVGIAARPAVVSPNGGETLMAGAGGSVTWGGGPTTGRGFAVSLFQGAPENYIEGFESGSLPTGFSTRGPPWTIVGPTPGNATNAARSGPIGDNGHTELRLLLHVGSAASMTFARRVSTEGGVDWLSFHVDGIPVGASSGISSWGFPVYMPVTLQPGAHELVWVYEKNSGAVGGEDAVWVDSLFLPAVERAPAVIINGGTTPDATSAAWTVPNAPGTSYRVRVQRLGIAPWLAFDESDAVFTIQVAPPPTPTPPPPPAQRPPAQARCVVPNVKGKTVRAARTALARARCVLGRTTRAYSRKIKKNRIISQSKAPGTRHPRGTRVNVVVSRGRRR